MMMQPQFLADLNAEQMREITTRSLTELRYRPTLNEKLTHENAQPSLALQPEQRSLIEDEIEADLAAVAVEIEHFQPPAVAPETKQQAKRQSLLTHLPRREIRHEPESTTCQCGCLMQRIGEDVAENPDYVLACSPCTATFAASGRAQSARPSLSAGRSARDRQRHSHQRDACPGDGGQVRRQSDAVPLGNHVYTRGSGPG